MSEQPRARWHVSPQIIFGLAIVFFGLLLTAQNLGIARNISRVLEFWPMVFTFAGLAMVLDRDAVGSRRIFGGLLVFGGLWQTANSAFGFRLYIDDYWPLILVAIGVLMVVRSVQRPGSGAGPVDTTDGRTADGFVSNAAGNSRDEVVTSLAFLSGVKRNVFASNFRRANVTAVMGGVELDLRQSQASGGESVVDVFAMWGGIQIRIPPDWQVVSEIVPIMGGVDDRSGHVQPVRHRLVIKGMAVMGGVEVKS